MENENSKVNTLIKKHLNTYLKDDFYTLDGKNLHIYTIGDIIPSEDIKPFSKDLEKHGIEVIVHDMQGKVTAVETDLTSVVTLVLHSPVLSPIIALTGHGATWDTIKFFAKLSWSKVKGQKYTRYYSDREEKKDITFGIQAKINNNDYSFNFDGIQSENGVEIAMDKILDFFREQTEYKNWQTHIGKFNNEKLEWEIKELTEIIKEQRNKSNE